MLASGSGTILDAMATAGVAIELVLVDRACRATDVAASHGISAVECMRDTYGPEFDRAAYTDRVAVELARHEIDLVVMAGFGTILDGSIYHEFGDRVVNTHPALLPSFPGWRAVEAAMEYGVKVTGCTVHVATATVDDGPILAQEAVTVADDDTVESLHERIKEVERRIYVATVQSILERGYVLPPSVAQEATP